VANAHPRAPRSPRSNIFTPINATLSNVEVQIKGNLHLPQDIPTIQALGECDGISAGREYALVVSSYCRIRFAQKYSSLVTGIHSGECCSRIKATHLVLWETRTTRSTITDAGVP
jgi:hypothetical protein